MSHRSARLRITALAIGACGAVATETAAGTVGASTVVGRARASSLTAAIRGLTVGQRAGQRVIYSYSGLNPPAALLSLIRNGEAAGVIFFRGNISSPTQISRVMTTLERANASPRTNPVRAPLLLMTDQEGGEVRRLPGAPALPEKQIGQSAHPAATATAAGTRAVRNLHGVGLNLNLPPVLHLFRTPWDFADRFRRL